MMRSGLPKPRAAQRGGGGFGDCIDAAEVQLESGFGGRQQLRHQLEHLGVVLAHLVQMVQQFGGEFACVRITHESGESGQFGRPLRQFVHLAVGRHLQPVLDAAQEAVGCTQFARGIARHVPGARQHRQRPQRGRDAQSRIAAAPHQLQRLRQEFDLADAAFAQLHIVAGDARQRVRCVGQRAALVLVDAAFHRMDVGDRGEIQPAPPDEGADRLEECRTQRQVAGDRSRLDHGGAFPVLAHALVVGDRCRQRDRGRRHGRIGAQPQVGAEYVAIGVACLHQGHKAARDARREHAHRMTIARFRVYCGGRVVEQHEVHIGRIIQFTGAEFAHAQRREPGAARRIGWIGQAELARVVRGTQQMRHRQRQRGLRKIAQHRGDAFERPDAADVGNGGGQRHDTLGAAHRGCDPIAPGGGRDRRQVRHRRGDHRVRPQGDQRTQAGRLAHRKFREERAVAAERIQQRDDLRTCRQPCLGTTEPGEAFGQPLRGSGIVRARPARRQMENRVGHSAESWA